MERRFDELPVSVCCHPSKNVIAVGHIDGSINVNEYEIVVDSMEEDISTNLATSSTPTATSVVKFSEFWARKHKASVRKIKFSPSGHRLYSLTRNKALTHWDTETGSKLRCIQLAHDDRPFSMTVVSDNQLASGDESGVVKFWDWRRTDEDPCVFRVSNDTGEYISDMISGDDGKTLLATCGDYTLLTVDTRKRKIVTQSENMNSELLSLTSICKGKRVACGAADGYLEIFNWGQFGNIVERIDTRHKEGIDCLQEINSSLLATGSADGTVRLVNVMPNRSLGIVGRHEGGVEDLALTFDGKHLISCGQDNKVKFYSVELLKRSTGAGKTKSGAELKKRLKRKRPTMATSSFFNDLDDSKI